MSFFRWLRAVFTQWLAGLTGGVLIGLVALYSGLSGVAVPPRVYEIVVVIVLFQAMFLAWREQEQLGIASQAELREYREPRLNLEFRPETVGFLQPATHIGGEHSIYIRILPTTPSRLDRCVGYLDEVHRRVGNEWRPVGLNGRRPLHWSEVHEQRLASGERPREANEVTIVAGSPQFLDVAYFVEGENILRLAVDSIPIETAHIFNQHPDDLFRFDIRVIGQPHANEVISLAIQRTERWNAPHVDIVRRPS